MGYRLFSRKDALWNLDSGLVYTVCSCLYG
nr:MAG TPA: hypothetical protein [Caudoviricetes sp.]